MSAASIPDDLIRHLCNISTLTPSEAEKLAAEVVHYFGLTLNEFVVQRHQELQKAGYANTHIFVAIEREIAQRVFPATPLSVRQIRRLIYG